MQIDEENLNKQTQSWIKHILKELDKQNQNQFDHKNWHLDKIITVLDDTNSIKEFITYKLTTQPTQHHIPKAISLKFKYLDLVFFTSFTQNRPITPAYQKEFTDLLKAAISKYKHKNEITLTNREMRDSI